MNNFRNVNNHILKDLLLFRKEKFSSLTCDKARKHLIYFDELSRNILKNVPKENKKYIQKQLDKLNQNFMDYLCYLNKKYYRNSFCDGVQIIMESIEE